MEVEKSRHERSEGHPDERSEGRVDERSEGRVDERSEGHMDERSEGHRMNRPTLILALVSALCLGGAFGFMGGVVFSRYHLLHHGGPGDFEHGRHFGRRGPGGDRGVPSPRNILPHLQRMLDLTPEQSEAIRREIEGTRGEFARVRDSLHARIERHLTPQQRETWRAAMARERNPGEPRGRDPRTFRADPGREGDSTR